MPGMSVEPYWEITFDADGDPDRAQRDRLTAGVGTKGVTDLLIFSHGWNSDRSGATSLYDRFLAPVPGLLAGRARPGTVMGYAGVLWPSMRFSDEPIPDFGTLLPGPEPLRPEPALDTVTCDALVAVFPGHEDDVRRIAGLLEERPDGEEPFAEFAALVRRLTGVPPEAVAALCADDTSDAAPGAEPAVLCGDPVAACEEYAAALEGGTGLPLAGGGWTRLWNGAKEMLRQATYYAMKRRAGAVGERGLGPILGGLARAHPSLSVHLVGHSFGGRLVSYALLGLPDGVRAVKSVTLLQGAFSHYAFASRLPHDGAHGGALSTARLKVAGPVVSCYSRHDTALGTMYPIASRLAGDDRGFGADLGERWGAMGHDGIKAVGDTMDVPLAEALRGAFPRAGCVSVDASAVVSRGGPPSGAHSDICHPELARIVLRAGRLLA
ncbi:hypothetical protein SAMN05216252_11473 [Actinacidiphila glaucinigra]|uniref:Serine-threonine protein kinase n=2 Tax=Actinacidiphila glaucinigra TaxID=235986 RepID=A0A239JWW6_9ACTN|nr:hypothetical protein SAMN05216252_11473 [Actinacidiphila glaucinigra]